MMLDVIRLGEGRGRWRHAELMRGEEAGKENLGGEIERGPVVGNGRGTLKRVRDGA